MYVMPLNTLSHSWIWMKNVTAASTTETDHRWKNIPQINCHFLCRICGKSSNCCLIISYSPILYDIISYYIISLLYVALSPNQTACSLTAGWSKSGWPGGTEMIEMSRCSAAKRRWRPPWSAASLDNTLWQRGEEVVHNATTHVRTHTQTAAHPANTRGPPGLNSCGLVRAAPLALLLSPQ